MAGLGEYERKRDFGKTAEPAPRKKGAKGRKGAPRFVVQEHSATRLHWDLRLEHDGVGVSWAVPNGIPRDPAENRKAVHTEDHPLDYFSFEGEIPKGEYGAGTMRIWDHGTFEVEKWRDDEIIFAFDGERLHGRYALFRAGGPKDWMIHRIDPPEGERDPFPEPLPPMLANEGTLPKSTRGWAAELAWGGVRAIARCRPGRIELRDAELEDIGARWPEVHRLTRQIGAHDVVLDGELVVFDADGRPDRERLARRDKPGSDSAIRRRAREYPATYVIFDLLFLDGEDLIGAPYKRRRELLAGPRARGRRLAGPGERDDEVQGAARGERRPGGRGAGAEEAVERLRAGAAYGRLGARARRRREEGRAPARSPRTPSRPRRTNTASRSASASWPSPTSTRSSTPPPASPRAT